MVPPVGPAGGEQGRHADQQPDADPTLRRAVPAAMSPHGHARSAGEHRRDRAQRDAGEHRRRGGDARRGQRAGRRPPTEEPSLDLQLAPATAKPAPSLRPPLPTAMRLGTTAVRQVAAKPTPRRALQRSPDDRDALLGTEVVAELGKPTVDHRGDVEEVGALVAADEQGLTQGEVRAEAEADQGGREQQENRGEPRPTAAPRRPVSGGGSLEYQASVTGRCHPDAMPGNPEPAGQAERKASTIAARHARRLGLWWSSGDRPRRTTIRSRGGHSISD